ncbi:MAG: DUF2809 domain-containing protein [Janthinobacterium lividum]
MAATFRREYFLLTTLLFGIEAGIAAFAHDALLRPYGGDLLATVLLYCLLRSFWAGPAARTIWAALLVSYVIEASQYAHLLARLGLLHSLAARLVLGSQFEWGDVLAYTLGALLVAAVERGRAAWPE